MPPVQPGTNSVQTTNGPRTTLWITLYTMAQCELISRRVQSGTNDLTEVFYDKESGIK